MDPKKSANLTPELKEIYDRVMNTTPSSKQPNPLPQQPTAQTSQTPPPVQTPPLPPQPAPALNPADEALSETPPRPLTTGNTFSFNGTVKNDSKNQNEENATSPTKGKTKISLPILIVLGVVFIVVWAVFWAIIFGFIKK